MAADVTLTHDAVLDLAPAYVLGALERDEEAAVAEHLRTCPESHEELAELGSVVPYLADVVPQVEPPVSLRARILAAAADDLAQRGADRSVVPGALEPPPAAATAAAAATRPVAPTPPTLAPTPASAAVKPPDNVVPIDSARRRSRLGSVGVWATGLAAVLAIVALGGWNLSLQNDLASANTFKDHLASTFALGQQPGSQVAILASAAGPSGPGGVAVMPASGRGQLVVTGLAPTSGNQVYEIWAIGDGKAPVPVGWFTTANNGNGYFDNMPQAVGEPLTVALTLETQKDPPAPTTPVLVSGPAVVNS